VARELLLGRIATPGIAIAAGVFAWLYGDLIALLGTFAFGTFGAALAPALGVGFNWRGVTARAASASIATGLFGNLALEFLARQTFFPALPRLGWLAPGVLPTAVSLAASFAVLFAVSLWDGRRGETALPADVAAVMEM
jgi:Na+/proline symporter